MCTNTFGGMICPSRYVTLCSAQWQVTKLVHKHMLHKSIATSIRTIIGLRLLRKIYINSAAILIEFLCVYGIWSGLLCNTFYCFIDTSQAVILCMQSTYVHVLHTSCIYISYLPLELWSLTVVINNSDQNVRGKGRRRIIECIKLSVSRQGNMANVRNPKISFGRLVTN